MKSNYTRFIVFLASLSLLIGCQREASDFSPRRHVINASLNDSATRTIFVEKDGSYDLLTKWQGHEYIQVFLKDGDSYNEAERKVQVSKVSQDGTGATFSYRVPDEWGNIDSYDVKMFTTPCFPKFMDGKIYFNASMIREPISEFQVPVYSEGEIEGEGVLNATFHHYYTYELLHIQNTSDSDIEFSLLGFNGTPWFKEKGSLCIDDDSFVVDAPSTKQPEKESRPITIKPGESEIIVSAYIPNGNTIHEATMVTKINGEYVYSSNTKSSGITLKQGHAYHMYAGWNGEELKFWKAGDEPLDVRTLSATIDPQSLSGEFTGVVVNPPLTEYKTGFRFWKENNPEDYVEYDSTASDEGAFSLDLTYKDFVYIANEGPVVGTYYVSAFAIDAKGNRHHGNTLEFTIENGEPETPVIPEPVDMGLPSGTKWAPYNVGSTKPQEVGRYFSWGEVNPKSRYDWSTYKHADGTADSCHDIGDDISGTEHDVARQKWGMNWSMPTLEQAKELFMNSSIAWTSQGGVKGVEITSRINGNSIFIPVSGVYSETELYGSDRYCYYWTSIPDGVNKRLANHFISNYSGETEDAIWGTGREERCLGLPVRPVYVGSDPEVATPEIVDLGLSVKWASFNLGASKPEEYGDYYAWGETEPYYSSKDPLTWKEGKEEGYHWHSYKWCMGSYNTQTKYCTDSSLGYTYGYNGFTDGKSVLDLEDDAAHVNLGGKWRMPTREEQYELREKCSWEWTQVNGVSGRKVTGPNGNSIFLPAAGVMLHTYLRYDGSDGIYWSSSLSTDYSLSAYDFHFGSGNVFLDYDYRYFGYSVRPVYDDSETKPEIKTPEPIDLGLPSGRKWASFNLGATKPEEYGNYFAWGETTEKDYYGPDNYVWMDDNEKLLKYNDSSEWGMVDRKEYLDAEDDVAIMRLGNSWRMPADYEIVELITVCSHMDDVVEGVAGRRFTGSNGNSIFIPYSGYKFKDEYRDNGACLWTNCAWFVTFAGALAMELRNDGHGYASKEVYGRYSGLPVRPVVSRELNIRTSPGEPIDLGLPSGTLWASCNVGAPTPESFGHYFAWGEVTEKEDYSWDNYIYRYGEGYSRGRYLSENIAGTSFDAAHVNWGGKWRMPSKEEFDELYNHCSREWTTQKGVPGLRFTGPNGKSVFFPAAGRYSYRPAYWLTENGVAYWSSTQDEDMYVYMFDTSGVRRNGGNAFGHPIRPVCFE